MTVCPTGFEGFAMRLPDKAALLLPFREAGAQPLRVGVVVGSSRAPLWVHDLLQFLSEIPGIQLETMLVASERPQQRLGWLMERLYSASRRRFNPFSETELVAGELHTCDVLIWLAAGKDPEIDLRSVAKYGAFTVQLGVGDGPIPFWEEVSSSQPTTSVTIFWHDVSLGAGRVVRRAEVSTVPGLYFTLNAEEPLVAVIRMLGAVCLDLRDGRLRLGAGEAKIYGDKLKHVPLARFIWRRVYGRLTRRGKDPGWFIAVRRNAGGSIADQALAGFNAIPLPAGSKEMADPFLWEADGHTWLLFEDIPAGKSRGRLACMELRKDGSCGGMELVLERDYHLSYPCVVRSKGELFLLPESAEARQVQLYRIARFPSQVELVSLLAEDLAVVDTTPILLNDRWYFFTTTTWPFMETLLFWSDRLDGRWHLHPASPISCSVKNSRSAGHLFWKNGRLFRPTQDCSLRYGYAIRLNEVVRLTPTEFEERQVQWVPPSWMPGLLGTHTWNESNEWQVVDGLR